MKVGFIKLFLSYLKEHYKSIVLFCLLGGILVLVFSLYNLPQEPLLYSGALVLLTLLIAFIIDFTYYYKHHLYMLKLRRERSLGIDHIPRPANLTEEDYTVLIDQIQQEKTQLIFHTDRIKSEMIDYYTLWVHQIKTPISAMTLLLQSQDWGDSAELEDELFKIEQYVEMVLSYLRLDSGTNDLLIKEYDLDKIVREAVHKYAGQFVRKKIRLQYEPLAQTALTDEKWLRFVVEQLLSNALKYTRAGQISIYMEKGARCTLVIADTGMGITTDDLPRVFEKGYTGYNGRRDKKSTGIGLYLCRRILTRLSHTIRIESAPGQGSRVLIDLAHIPLEIE